MSSLTLTIDAADVGKRLDLYLSERSEGLTRSQSKRLVLQGCAATKGKALKPAEMLSLGQVVEVHLPDVQPSRLEGEAIPLEVLYEDDDMIVINKPAGIVVHPGAGNTKG